MPVIDIHTHVFPAGIAERALQSLITQSRQRSEDRQQRRDRHRPYYDGTVEGLLATMDHSGVDISVVQPIATRPGQVKSINDWTAAAAAAANGRIVPFGAMHPGFEEPAAEIERMASLGLRGIKLHPEFQEFDPLDPCVTPILKAAKEHGLIILFHAGADPSYDTVRGTPKAYRTLIEENPGLTIILAHMGGFDIWDEVAKHLVGLPVYLDTAFALGYLPDDEAVAIVRAHGSERIVFGSDGPWTDVRKEIALWQESGLDNDELEPLLWRNAADMLGLKV
ncbi:MAG: amidohydrolase family protein [Coriobacteriia bacterium]|nr:amidohydrolase family protein [Coriobacteriia bacterium]